MTVTLACRWAVWFALLVGLISSVSTELLDDEQLMQVNGTHFDYIILGGGTAGLVVASRLSEDPNITVAVIEAGNFEKNNPNVTNTTGLGLAKNTRIDWQYESVPQVFGGNQSLIFSAGKGLGGSSLINGMTYIRPSKSQIDLWPSLGLELDWNRYFTASKKGEHFRPPTSNLSALGAAYQNSSHGYAGPLDTCINPHIIGGDIHDIFNSTFKKLGIPPRCDFCGGDLRGFGIQDVTVDQIADVREDAARAYYYPFMNRKNLVVMVNTTATRILWSPSPQNRPNGNAVASAAEVVSHQNGQVSTIYADREIVLSAGAIRSPAILEHSGVGNPAILSRQSIEVKIPLSSVGENFQDQTVITILASTVQESPPGFPPFVAHASLHDLFGTETASVYNTTLAKLPQYADAIISAQHNGVAGSNANASIVQQHLLKTQLDLLFESKMPASEIAPIALGKAIGCVFWPLQPFSRGSVHINSTDRTVQPTIDAQFFRIDFDGQLSVATARFVRKFLTTPPLSAIVNASSLVPGFATVPEDATDAQWLDWIKTSSQYQPNYHHLGTCAMLPRDKGGVVDNDFRVYGTANVRVVDLSVVPLQVAGHSTALLYGIAEWATQKMRSQHT
ncbi:hypothetical protein H2202_000063 [Exophiala xenobiotica]|nr:hypothetical protein H2202_000063 [Exophiala xenobiotica]KAK5236781.1 hypothetical protein LTR47_001959 [Exophiala xenobiotica]KAK5251105.1 hypothetical protein LTS06_004255 [Exophiala xenobiotica]KAK5258352.1 hypothetical protein LTR40_008066 [Exophiala xenobiotica]KAK5328349.1 hypothetical protein LTR93_002134 [Exophiala xenobiotica]